MNIRELKLFTHLAGTLHFGRTSRACNITPSGLTRTIQRLENELGKKLFSRDQRSVLLTPSGTLFYAYAEQVLQLWNKLQNELNRDDTLRGELSLYCSVTAILSILPTLLERFRIAHPQVHIKVQTGDAAMALSRLANNEADISIAALPDDSPGTLECIKILETPLLFIAPGSGTKTIIYSRGRIDWRKTPLILAERGLSRTRTEAWFRDKGITPNIYSQVAGNEAIITLVSMGYGIGIIPELVLQNSPMKNKVRIVSTSPPLQPFSVGVCTTGKNLRNPIVKAFWQNVKSDRKGVQS
jgi:LysR family transcriptional regulator, positive regulator for ilvC